MKYELSVSTQSMNPRADREARNATDLALMRLDCYSMPPRTCQILDDAQILEDAYSMQCAAYSRATMKKAKDTWTWAEYRQRRTYFYDDDRDLPLHTISSPFLSRRCSAHYPFFATGLKSSQSTAIILTDKPT